ncbi:MAG: amidohydrolase [Lutibacter sp.]|uniref:amidohydrolase n=1 Tax=Lutibacter sp. TaxID=1925666 RepID=UPI00299F089F|nr:amidohydrolase [Lutibacter sp.]MDX1830018.1 amidohydrolase [Lutibacter sp.]
MQNLKVAFIQSNLIWHNAEENRKKFTQKINLISEKVDLIILPEMFTTGFSMQPENISETMQGETVQWMKKFASLKNTVITGSIIIKENEAYFNRLLFVHPSGEVEIYNKRHLFSLAGEDKVYKAGTEKKIFNVKGWKICPQICYDLRFPVFARNTENYDLLFYVANWPKQRINAWDALLKARAIENMSYVVGVNRVGKDANNFEYNGHSAAYDCLGEEISKTKLGEEDTVILTLDKNYMDEVRNKLNFLKDKDSFEIKN